MESAGGAAWTAIRNPGLWSLGLLGFLVRGGVVVILAPMFALPSPVGLSVLIGPDLVDANGLSARVLGLLLGAGALAAGLLGVALLLAAVADLDAFEGLLSAAGVAARRPSRWGRARLVGQLILLQAVAVAPAAVAAVPAVATAANVTQREILLPSSQTVPLVWRVAEGASAALLAVAVLVILAGYGYSWMSRELLGQRLGLITRRGWQATLPGVVVTACGDALTRPWRVAATTAIATLGSIGSAVGAVGAIALGWTVAQGAFLGPAAGPVAPSGGPALLAWIPTAAATMLLVSLVAGALVVLAATAAIRSALLTQATLQVVTAGRH